MPAATLTKKPSFTVEGETAMESLILSISDALAPADENEFDPFDEKWQRDPVGWCQAAFGETYTPSQIAILEAIRDYEEVIGHSATGVGKTYIAARAAIWKLFCFPKSQTYLVAAPPLSNLQMLLWGQIEGLVADHPDLFKHATISGMSIELGPKWWIQGLTVPKEGVYEEKVSRFSGKHAPYMFFILDEADGIPPFVFEGIDGCTSGGEIRILYMFNPKADRGIIYQKEKNKQAHVIPLSALDHPNVLTGENLFPGAVSREKVVRRILEWSRPLKPGELETGDIITAPDFLVGCTALARDGVTVLGPLEPGRRKATLPQLMYMVFAQYPSQSESKLISSADYHAAVNRWREWVDEYGEVGPKGVDVVLGFDPAESLLGDESVLCRRDGEFVYQFLTWRGKDPTESCDDVAPKAKGWRAQVVFVDSNGVGAGVPTILKRKGIRRAVGVKASFAPTAKTEIGEFRRLRDQLLWSIALWLRTNPLAMLPPDPDLEEELLFLEFEVRDGYIWITPKDDFRETYHRSTDRMDALALTFAPLELERSRVAYSW